jgi:hypothetical protein
MQGTEGHFAAALPHDALVALLERYGRLEPGHRGKAQGAR